MRKIMLWLLLGMFFLPLVSADVIMPFSLITIPFFPVILIVELIAFWLLANKTFKIKVGFWKSLLIVAVGNIITSLIGTIIPTYRDLAGPILIAFILSVIIEFVVFLLFFIKKKVKKLNLFWISLIINALSYLVLLLVMLTA